MANDLRNSSESNGPILHVIVVGFHHKKGCQVCFFTVTLSINVLQISKEVILSVRQICGGGYVFVHKLK
jgi:hypothetical protein